MAFTDEEKQIALRKARKSVAGRSNWAASHTSNKFENWGNSQSLHRTSKTIRAMENGTASDNQWRYWLNAPIVLD